jgi:diaminopimelate epimerase
MMRKYDLVFTKAVASGNDFIIIDNKSGELDDRQLDYSRIAKEICSRRTAVGADGLLVLESSIDADFKMRIINPDGSEVDMCGNGARCSAYYASLNGWGQNLAFETGAGIISAVVTGDIVKLRMSDPKDTRINLNLGVGNHILVSHFINTGVPHVVHIVEEDLEAYNVREVGRLIRKHPFFAPDGTNANFVKPLDKSSAVLRTYERGVEEETLACGTGTTASAIILGLLGYVSSPVKMRTKSGEVLNVYYDIKAQKISNVYLEGAAKIIFEGKI